MKDETPELVRGTGNVLRDLGRENADVEQLKALLAAEIIKALDRDRLTFDLMTASFQTDSTRVVTFHRAIEQSNRAYREIVISDSHHGLTHHGGDQEKIEKCIRINRYEVEQFAYFIGKLKATQDGDGSLFDHIMVSYGSGLGRDHDDDNLPTIVTGRGIGLFSLGRHIKFPSETPLANLHLTMAQQMGVPAESFADSTGNSGNSARCRPDGKVTDLVIGWPPFFIGVKIRLPHRSCAI